MEFDLWMLHLVLVVAALKGRLPAGHAAAAAAAEDQCPRYPPSTGCTCTLSCTAPPTQPTKTTPTDTTTTATTEPSTTKTTLTDTTTTTTTVPSTTPTTPTTTTATSEPSTTPTTPTTTTTTTEPSTTQTTPTTTITTTEPSTTPTTPTTRTAKTEPSTTPTTPTTTTTTTEPSTTPTTPTTTITTTEPSTTQTTPTTTITTTEPSTTKTTPTTTITTTEPSTTKTTPTDTTTTATTELSTTPTTPTTTPTTPMPVYMDCQAAYEAGGTKSGVYSISPQGSSAVFNVSCEQESLGGGWAVFQRRFDGSVDFFRGWNEYKNGFGNIQGEFWLGNDYLHLMTRNNDQSLRIEMEENDDFVFADYCYFSIDNETARYRLNISHYNGSSTAGDSLVFYHNGMFFTTYDNDNDLQADLNCASENCHGAWWYNGCHVSDLNGEHGNDELAKGINWFAWKGYETSLDSTRMMNKARP